MRKWITTIAVAVLALALAGVALAKFSQVAKVTLTAHEGRPIDRDKCRASTPATRRRSGRSRGRPRRSCSHSPRAAKFYLRTPLRTSCTLDLDRQPSDQFGPSCPSRSLIGTGHRRVSTRCPSLRRRTAGSRPTSPEPTDRPGDQADSSRLRLEDHRDPRHRCGPDDDDSGSAALDRRVRGQPPTEVR